MQKIVRWLCWRRHAVRLAPTHPIQSSLPIWKKVERIFKNRTAEINRRQAANRHCRTVQVNHIPSLVLNHTSHRSEIDRPQHPKTIAHHRPLTIIVLKHRNKCSWHMFKTDVVIQTKVLHRHAHHRPSVRANHRYSNSSPSIWKRALVQQQITVPRSHQKNRPVQHHVPHKRAHCTAHRN